MASSCCAPTPTSIRSKPCSASKRFVVRSAPRPQASLKLEKEQSGSYGAPRPCAFDRLRWPAYRTWYSHSPARARHPQPQASCRTAACRPMDDDSGDHKGTRFIKGDRARARKTLFMAAFSGALHHNPLLKAFYALLVKRGKEHILAVVACTASLSLSSTPCSTVAWNP